MAAECVRAEWTGPNLLHGQLRASGRFVVGKWMEPADLGHGSGADYRCSAGEYDPLQMPGRKSPHVHGHCGAVALEKISSTCDSVLSDRCCTAVHGTSRDGSAGWAQTDCLDRGYGYPTAGGFAGNPDGERG